jgi:hypothetical protein
MVPVTVTVYVPGGVEEPGFFVVLGRGLLPPHDARANRKVAPARAVNARLPRFESATAAIKPSTAIRFGGNPGWDAGKPAAAAVVVTGSEKLKFAPGLMSPTGGVVQLAAGAVSEQERVMRPLKLPPPIAVRPGKAVVPAGTVTLELEKIQPKSFGPTAKPVS